MSFNAYRGRAGPRTSTPGSVRCQKCLERGHYSYECKKNPQERPYIARPSRSQQLANPKLRQELNSDVPNLLEKKPGAADSELAKIEAERARQRERQAHEDALLVEGERLTRGLGSGNNERVERGRQRTRSVSSESVSSFSSRSRSRSVSRVASRSSRRNAHLTEEDEYRGRDASPARSLGYRNVDSRRSSRSSRRSLSRSRSRTPSERSLSPPPARPAGRSERQARGYDSRRERSVSPAGSYRQRERDGRRGGEYRSISRERDSPPPPPPPQKGNRTRSRSRSPDRRSRYDDSVEKERRRDYSYGDERPPSRFGKDGGSRRDDRDDYKRDRDMDREQGQRDNRENRYSKRELPPTREHGRYRNPARADPPPREPRSERREPPRERSLSPYSKRLAMTQSLNTGRR